MCTSFSSPSSSKTKVMDMSYFVYEDDTSIVIPYPSTETIGVRALFEPFQTRVISLQI